VSDLFICPHKKNLKNWSEACPDGKIHAAVSSVRARKQKHLFWLHAEFNNEQWVTDTIAEILGNFPEPRIIVLTNVPDQAQAIEILKLGAAGYCHAYMPAEVLREVKAVVEHGGLWLGQELLQRLIMVSTTLAGNRPEHIRELTDKLTSREKEVALEAAKGLSNKQIARDLKITERTVKAHLQHIFERLKVKDRLQLALLLSERRSVHRPPMDVSTSNAKNSQAKKSV
jgi:two-component system nitrate/nitrite response regulator NarL